jgi:hypothetical protein
MAERLRAVMAAAFANRAGGVRDAALLGSATHPLVKPVVERVTNRRVAYITDMYVQLGLPKARARRRALILYASYLGLFDCLRVEDLDDTELRDCARELLATIVPDDGAPRAGQRAHADSKIAADTSSERESVRVEGMHQE